ncbi:hypothetical protein Tco_1270213 [Tanacetum coccineum]
MLCLLSMKRVYLKNAAIPQVLAIHGGRIRKPNKKPLAIKGNVVGHWRRNCLVYLAELMKKKQAGTTRTLDYGISVSLNDVLYFNAIPHDGIYEIDMLHLVLIKKRIEKLQHGGILKSTDSVLINTFLVYLVCGCEALVKQDTLDKLQQRSIKCIFVGYPKETMGYYFYFLPKNKIVAARYSEFLEKNLISQEASGRVVELKEVQDEDTSPFENTCEYPVEAESFKPPQVDVDPIRRSVRTYRAPKRLCLNVEVDEHCLGELNEPTNYKVALLDPKSKKWLDAMNAEMQSL